MGGDSTGAVGERGGDVKVGWGGSAAEIHPAVRAAAARIRKRCLTYLRGIFQIEFIAYHLKHFQRILSIPKLFPGHLPRLCFLIHGYSQDRSLLSVGDHVSSAIVLV
jgi:hypothetical protein